MMNIFYLIYNYFKIYHRLNKPNKINNSKNGYLQIN